MNCVLCGVELVDGHECNMQALVITPLVLRNAILSLQRAAVIEQRIRQEMVQQILALESTNADKIV